MSKFVQDRSGLRAVALATIALGLAGCSSAPELSEVKLLPEMRSFLPSNSNTYASATAMRALPQVTPQDLVDGQGLCAGAAAPAPANAEPGSVVNPGAQPAAVPQPVALEMTECQVVQALGMPARAEIGSNERGDRTAVLTFAGSDRGGIYRFTGGRLTVVERGAEAAAPAKPDKKATKKAAPAKRKPAA